MRLHELFESTIVNVKALQDIADHLLANKNYGAWPINIEFDLAFINEIDKKYGKVYKNFLKYINGEMIKLQINTNTAKGSGTYEYVPPNKRIVVNVSDDYGAMTVGINPRTTLVHELRHVFQEYSHSEHFFNHTYDKHKDYTTNPVEIDAAFHHILTYHDDVLSGKDFVKHVMRTFDAYKRLTDKQYEHYKRKAAAYWQARHNSNTTPYSRAVKNVLKIDTMQLEDLRTIGHPMSKRFFMRTKRFNAALRQFFNGKYDDNSLVVKQLIVYLSFIYAIKPFNIKAILKERNINLNDVIDAVENQGLFDGYDKNFILEKLEAMK